MLVPCLSCWNCSAQSLPALSCLAGFVLLLKLIFVLSSPAFTQAPSLFSVIRFPNPILQRADLAQQPASLHHVHEATAQEELCEREHQVKQSITGSTARDSPLCPAVGLKCQICI